MITKDSKELGIVNFFNYTMEGELPDHEITWKFHYLPLKNTRLHEAASSD